MLLYVIHIVRHSIVYDQVPGACRERYVTHLTEQSARRYRSMTSRESSTDCWVVNQEVKRTERTRITLTATNNPPNADRFSSPAASILISSARKLLRNIITQPCAVLKGASMTGSAQQVAQEVMSHTAHETVRYERTSDKPALDKSSKAL